MSAKVLLASVFRALVVVAALLVLQSDSAEGEIASYYGYELAGSPTASGEPFDPRGYTAASWVYPLGTELLVCYPETGACATVRVNDRGPAAGLGRDLDLSLGAADAIGLRWAGVDAITVEVVGT